MEKLVEGNSEFLSLLRAPLGSLFLPSECCADLNMMPEKLPVTVGTHSAPEVSVTDAAASLFSKFHVAPIAVYSSLPALFCGCQC